MKTPRPFNDALFTEIGKRIRARRKAIHVNQSLLAWTCGFERATTISDIEKGNCRVQLDTLYKIAQMLDVSIYELLPPEKTGE